LKQEYGPPAAGALIVITLAAIHIPVAAPVFVYTGAFIAASALYLLLSWFLLRTGISSATVAVLVALALVLRLSFLVTPPVGSDDVGRYLWDGRVQAGGVNPYRYPPDAVELGHLHTPLLPSHVNHPEMKSAYFPLDEWAFAASYLLSGESIWGWKLLLLLSEVLTLAGLRLLIGQAGRPARLILLYALCPLPIMSFALDGHVDALGLPFLVFALFHHLRGRKIISLILLGLAIAVKPVALVLLPVLFFGEKTLAGRMRVVLIPPLTVIAGFLPYLGEAGPWESFVTLTQHWAFNGSVFSILYGIMGDNQQARLLCGILLAGALVFIARTGTDFLTKAYLAILLLLLFSPVVHPWYVVWLTVLLPAIPFWSGLTFSSTVSLTAFTVLSYITGGAWKEYPAVILLEYLPVTTLLLMEVRRGIQRAGAIPHTRNQDAEP
jgi:alpha-1,6-mannosyltransferase